MAASPLVISPVVFNMFHGAFEILKTPASYDEIDSALEKEIVQRYVQLNLAGFTKQLLSAPRVAVVLSHFLAYHTVKHLPVAPEEIEQDLVHSSNYLQMVTITEKIHNLFSQKKFQTETQQTEEKKRLAELHTSLTPIIQQLESIYFSLKGTLNDLQPPVQRHQAPSPNFTTKTQLRLEKERKKLKLETDIDTQERLLFSVEEKISEFNQNHRTEQSRKRHRTEWQELKLQKQQATSKIALYTRQLEVLRTPPSSPEEW